MIGAGSTVALADATSRPRRGFSPSAGSRSTSIVVPSNSAMQQQIAVNALNISGCTGSPDPIRAVDKGAPSVILRVDSVASAYAIVSKADDQDTGRSQGPYDLARRTKGHHSGPTSIV